jgi:hypothetical protein
MAETLYQMLDRIEASYKAEASSEASALSAASSLEFLQKVYSNPRQPMSRRLRAAIAALPFEHPKLALVARFDPGEGFAAKLEAAIKRGARPLIEGTALLQPADGGGVTNPEGSGEVG